MNIRFLKSKEKKKIIEELEKKFGISNLPYLLIETGKEKIRGFSGTMSKDEIIELSKIANIEIIGSYMVKSEEGGLRLSLDAVHILKDSINKSFFEVNEEQMKIWMKGNNLEVQTERGIFIIKFKDDLLGCGVSDGKKIINFIPKERRIRN